MGMLLVVSLGVRRVGSDLVRGAHVLVLLRLNAYLEDASWEEEVVQHNGHDAGGDGDDDDVGG